MVFESVDQISNAKNLEDKYQHEIFNMNQLNKILHNEKTDIEQTMNKFLKERDQFRDDVKVLKDAKDKLEKQKD